MSTKLITKAEYDKIIENTIIQKIHAKVNEAIMNNVGGSPTIHVSFDNYRWELVAQTVDDLKKGGWECHYTSHKHKQTGFTETAITLLTRTPSATHSSIKD